jgi:hypothetical protein
MVEVGDIDWAAHADNMDLMLGTLQDINDVTNTVTEWVGKNGGWEENLVMVTADHDHYLSLLPNYPREIAESILATKSGSTNEATQGGNKGYDLSLTPTLSRSGTSQWSSGDAEKVGHFWGTTTTLKDGSKGMGDGWWTHTQRPVPIYAQGEGSELLQEFVSTGIEAYGTVIKGVPGMIDQAHVAEVMEAALLGGDTFEERLATAQRSVISPTVTATAGDDSWLIANPQEQLTFKANTIFMGSGSDEVDSGANGGFRNNIFTGSGMNTVYAGDRDVITGGSDADQLWAIDGNGNRLSSMAGDDEFILGSANNRALGGEGNDDFYILGTAGTNYLNGGGGADQFWIVSEPGDKPAAKQVVMDFKVGEDKVGLRGVAFSSLSFQQVGADTLLSVAGMAVGQFSNLSASALNNQSNFAGLI